MTTCLHPLATRPILYTDSINGEQTCRDDLWAVTTDELNALRASPGEADQRDAALEEAAKICDESKRVQLRMPVSSWWNGPDTAAECADDIRALKRQS